MSFSPDHELSAQEVTWLYRCILGREPESDEVVASHIRAHKNFDNCRQAFLSSYEFSLIFSPHTSKFYIPAIDHHPYNRSDKKLCLVAIVKDEAANIARMIRSCVPIIHFAIIVDTGSTDDTMIVAEHVLSEAGLAYILSKTDFTDFAQARNSALSLIPDDSEWILMMDADEEIVPEDYNRFKALLETPDVEGWRLPRFNFQDAAKRRPVALYPDYQKRLFRNRLEKPIRYVGKVHEEPTDVDWRCAPAADCEQGHAGGPHIHHLGFMPASQERWRKKHDLYASLGAYTKLGASSNEG